MTTHPGYMNTRALFKFNATSRGFETGQQLWQRQDMNKKSLSLRSFACVAAIVGAILFPRSLAWCATDSDGPMYGHNQIENPFDQAYWGLELARSTPEDKTKRSFDSGDFESQLTYRYRLSTGWLLGAHAGFKSLKRKLTSDGQARKLPLLSFGYESLKGWRVYHPVYLFAGGKLQYMLPATEVTLPVRRDPQYRAEFGAAAVAMVAIKPAGNWLLTGRLDRWRGLATTRLQGYESSLGLLYSF